MRTIAKLAANTLLIATMWLAGLALAPAPALPDQPAKNCDVGFTLGDDGLCHGACPIYGSTTCRGEATTSSTTVTTNPATTSTTPVTSPAPGVEISSAVVTTPRFTG